jgi:GST-like protein
MTEHELISSKGCGSVVVDMASALAGLPVRVTEIPYREPGPERERLLSLNPLGQVPVLVLPSGEVLTESAAMVLHLDDLAPRAGLPPPRGDARRPGALNQLVLLVAALYPTVTFSDPPEDWTLPGPAAAQLGARLANRKEQLWRRLEAIVAPAPFLYGARPSAIDLYVAVMTHWRPGPAWFQDNSPKLVGVTWAVAAFPPLAQIMARHFPPRMGHGPPAAGKGRGETKGET